MNKELIKPTIEKYGLQNRHLKYPSRENVLACKNIKNKCNNLLKRSKKKYIRDIKNKVAGSIKSFGNTFQPFITHKGIQTIENITIDVEKNEKVEVKGLNNKVYVKTKDR